MAQVASMSLAQFDAYCENPTAVTFDQEVETPAVVKAAIAVDQAVALAKQFAREYFSGTIELINIEGSVSREFEIALYRQLTIAREKARKAADEAWATGNKEFAKGRRAMVQEIYKIQYKALPSWFKGEQRHNKRNAK